jgi:lipopolysaccharide transport system permease protein
VDFLLSSIFLVALLAWYHRMPPMTVCFLPLLVILVFGASLGIGLWLAALTVEYRDFRYIVPFMVQIGLYLSPVGFQSGIVPDRFRTLYALNPMVGIIDGFRWCVLGIRSSTFESAIAIAVIDVAVLIASGIWYFRKTERTFADII